MQIREQVRSWHRMSDRRRFPASNSDPELADSPASVKARAPDDESIAAAHRQPGRQMVVDPDVELRPASLAVNRSLLAGKRLHRRRNVRKIILA
jgi:hypothetical protein